MTNKEILNKRLKLYNGVEMPQFGLGTYLVDEKDGYYAVITALRAGYRLIDTAEYYENEIVIGNAIKDFLKENNSVKRSDIFITSKIWKTNNGYQDAKKAFNNILKRLQIDFLDLCLIHWPVEESLECWKLLEEMYNAKKVRAIGVSNFTVEHLKGLMKHTKIMPMVNQIEVHPCFNQAEVVKYCQNNKIIITSWRTMMSGKTEKIPLLIKLAKKHKTSSTAIALRWAWQLNEVVIPKSVHKERIINNPNIGNFSLSVEEINEINNLPQKRDGACPENVSWAEKIDCC